MMFSAGLLLFTAVFSVRLFLETYFYGKGYDLRYDFFGLYRSCKYFYHILIHSVYQKTSRLVASVSIVPSSNTIRTIRSFTGSL